MCLGLNIPVELVETSFLVKYAHQAWKQFSKRIYHDKLNAPLFFLHLYNLSGLFWLYFFNRRLASAHRWFRRICQTHHPRAKYVVIVRSDLNIKYACICWHWKLISMHPCCSNVCMPRHWQFVFHGWIIRPADSARFNLLAIDIAILYTLEARRCSASCVESFQTGDRSELDACVCVPIWADVCDCGSLESLLILFHAGLV